MFRIAFFILGSILLLACNGNKATEISLPYYNDPDFTPFFIDNKDQISTRIKHRISDFSFVDQDSLQISRQTIEGKIHVANFVFTKCGNICPVMTKNMKIVSDSLQGNDDVIFLSFSVTPWIDKPHVLRNYKTKNNIKNKNWHFITGSKSEIYSLARQSYFAEEELGYTKDSTEFLHTEHCILVDRNRRIRGIYNGTLVLDMQQLLKDILVLKKEQ